MKKIFDIEEWLKKSSQNEDQAQGNTLPDNSETKLNHSVGNKDLPDIEVVVQRIEQSSTDITANYPDWRDIGFAFADEFGESGRDYYHRISRFYPHYSPQSCDKQYDNCLKADGQGISIKTFYHVAKKNGVDIRTSHSDKLPSFDLQAEDNSAANIPEASSKTIFDTPRLPSQVYENLPDILKECTDMFQDAIEKDVFLVGAIAVLSACLPNIEGIYFDEAVSAHIYQFVAAPAGSGKGKLKWAKFLGQKIHKSMTEESKLQKEEYQRELDEYNNCSKKERQLREQPQEPKSKMFFIPGNSSSSAFIQALSDNNFQGVIFETEADTLAATLKQEWGNFTDILRKAFHHESTNMFRRKDNEYIEIEDPHLAIILSGTPKQVHNMMPNVENGMFSRVLYYAFEDFGDFKNPFKSHSKLNYKEFFEQQGDKVYHLYQKLLNQPEVIQFKFTAEQGESFTEQFSIMYRRNRLLLGDDFTANSRRLGLITFRIAMILSSLRMLQEENFSNPLICNETDFQTAIKIAITLEKHAIAVFQNLPNNNLKGVKSNFYNALPDEFNRQDYLSIAKSLGIKDKTAEKYINLFKENDLLEHEYNNYRKTKNGK